MAGCPAGMVSSPGGGCVDPKESNQAGNNTTHRIQRRGGKMARGGRPRPSPNRKYAAGRKVRRPNVGRVVANQMDQTGTGVSYNVAVGSGSIGGSAVILYSVSNCPDPVLLISRI